MQTNPSKIWPDVSSPVAREILEYLFNRMDVFTSVDFESDIEYLEVEGGFFGLGEYWERINKSDIAKQLATGPTSEPEIILHLSSIEKLFYQHLLYPKTPIQHVNHYIRYLDYYIAPTDEKEEILRRYNLSKLPLAIIFIIVIVSFLLLITTSWFENFLPFLIVALGLYFYVQVRINWRMLLRRKDANKSAMRVLWTERNATVLYHYLKKEFKDSK